MITEKIPEFPNLINENDLVDEMLNRSSPLQLDENSWRTDWLWTNKEESEERLKGLQLNLDDLKNNTLKGYDFKSFNQKDRTGTIWIIIFMKMIILGCYYVRYLKNKKTGGIPYERQEYPNV